LIRRCKNYRNADQEVRGLLITIEVNWMKTEAQIAFLKRISQSLDARYRDVQSLVLSELEGKLKTATLTMDQLLSQERKGDEDSTATVELLRRMPLIKKAKYAFKKESLEKIIDDLETWQRRFDPSWMLIMRVADEEIDQQLDQEEKMSGQTRFIMAAKGVRDAARESTSSLTTGGSIFVSAEALSSVETPIPYSSVFLDYLSGSRELVLVDTMICNPIADVARTTRDVRKLSRILSKVDPATFGLLVCRGVITSSVKNPSPFISREIATFKFLFMIPPLIKNPKSLRALLIEADPLCPLNSRLDLAKQLTSSVLFVHGSQFVHKNIRPETIIIFESDSREIDSLFLVGFEKFRPVDGMTYRTSDGNWQRDLCTYLTSPSQFCSRQDTNEHFTSKDRHPTRQGTQPEEDYQMQHDIYSLGVVLLELGLWTSFITFSSPSAPSRSPSPDFTSPLFTPQQQQLEAQMPSFMQALLANKNILMRALVIKATLIEFARTLLPARMGQKYTDVVILCLECLDDCGDENMEGKVGWGSMDLKDEDEIVVGVRYIENILLKMRDISV
jgi:serine/threonine protein kinase